MTPVLEENGIPHHTQTAYQAGISCADPTEVVQEAVKNHIQHGSVVYQCFYDLEKAFDSVEYCVLLDHLYRSGINGKAWRLIRSFYHNLHGQVRIDGQLSEVPLPPAWSETRSCVIAYALPVGHGCPTN